MNNADLKKEISNKLIKLSYDMKDIRKSINDLNIRESWTNNSLCLIYSRKNKKWFNAEIVDIFVDKTTNQQWLTVKYNKKSTKKVQRFCKDIKGIGVDYDYNDKIMQFILNQLKQYKINKVSLKNKQKSAELLIYGYVRRMYNISRDIPADIKTLFVSFYLIVSDQWNINKSYKNYQYNHDKTILRVNGGILKSYHFLDTENKNILHDVFGSIIVKKGDIHSWRFDISFDDNAIKPSIRIGIFDANKEIDHDDEDKSFSGNQGGYAYMLYKDMTLSTILFFIKIENGKGTTGNYVPWQQGDVLTMTLDMRNESGILSFKVNDKDEITMFSWIDTSKQYCMAVSCLFDGQIQILPD